MSLASAAIAAPAARLSHRRATSNLNARRASSSSSAHHRSSINPDTRTRGSFKILASEDCSSEPVGSSNASSLARRAILGSIPAASIVSVSGNALAGGKIPAPEDVAAPPSDAEVTASGLASKVLKAGDGKGERPFAFDTVTVDYTGWTTDGKMFDSSVTRGKPSSFPLNAVIKGWTEGLQLMEIGETRRFWIPEGLAYKGSFGKPAGMLVFDVSLFGIKRGPRPPQAPLDVAAPPSDAEVTPSGLATKVLQASTKEGAKSPGPKSTVTVDYSGWNTAGALFDSSVVRGKKASFPVDYVIPGWTEGLQLMVEGERRRFWIPAELAYGKCPPPRDGIPCGMLVFDVELFGVSD